MHRNSVMAGRRRSFPHGRFVFLEPLFEIRAGWQFGGHGVEPILGVFRQCPSVGLPIWIRRRRLPAFPNS